MNHMALTTAPLTFQFDSLLATSVSTCGKVRGGSEKNEKQGEKKDARTHLVGLTHHCYWIFLALHLLLPSQNPLISHFFEVLGLWRGCWWWWREMSRRGRSRSKRGGGGAVEEPTRGRSRSRKGKTAKKAPEIEIDEEEERVEERVEKRVEVYYPLERRKVKILGSAPLGARLTARIIDGFLCVLFSVFFLGPMAPVSVPFILAIEILLLGNTIGKNLFGLVVVDQYSGKRSSKVRLMLIYLFICYYYFWGILVIDFSSSSKGHSYCARMHLCFRLANYRNPFVVLPMS